MATLTSCYNFNMSPNISMISTIVTDFQIHSVKALYITQATYEDTKRGCKRSICTINSDSFHFIFSVLQTIPATNRLSLPEVTKRMLRRICRKQVHSWLCCWSAYQHSSLYSASLCPRGHLHLAWPESARGCRERGGIWVERVCLIGHQSRLLKEPSIFFRNLFKWSFSVCE